MKVKEQSNAFDGNYHGILDHTGAVKVAGYDKTATIKYINIAEDGNYIDVLVKGTKVYRCDIHKDLLKEMCFCEIGDTAFIKTKSKSKFWLVGYRKAKSKFIEENIEFTGDMNLLDYFRQQKKLSDDYSRLGD